MLFRSASEPLAPLFTTDLVLSALLAIYNTVISETPKKNQEQMKEFLFEMFNVSASALLAQMAPDIDLRPDITSDAILELEESMINDKLSNM